MFDDVDNDKFYGGEKYTTHKIFKLIRDLFDFYDFLLINCSGYMKSALCVKDYGNIDNIMYGSIKGTVASIKALLDIGSINDAFALVRKYEDAIITNIYVDLLMEQEMSKFNDNFLNNEDSVFSDFYDNKINKWVYDETKLNDSKKNERTEKGIAEFTKVKDLNAIFNICVKNKTNSVTPLAKLTLRQFCNNNMHYNSILILGLLS